jgi:hypothetical protein
MDEACRMRKLDSTSQFLEFGVFKGVDLEFLSKALTKRVESGGAGQSDAPFQFHGFDSFVGLPAEWNSYDSGHFDCGGELPKRVVDDPTVILHKGWFEDTIPPFLSSHPDAPCAFIHADADLYSSTKCFLDALCNAGKIVVGTVIVFDEYWNYAGWEEGETLAFEQVSEQFSLESRPLAYHAPPTDDIDLDESSAANKYGYKSVAFIITKIQ